MRTLFLRTPTDATTVSPALAPYVRTYDAGEVLFEEGASGGDMYYILNGQVAVKKGGQVVTTLSAGHHVGEMALLLGETRTATVEVAEAGTRLVHVAEENFDIILRENPEIVRSLLHDMALRLKKTTDEL